MKEFKITIRKATEEEHKNSKYYQCWIRSYVITFEDGKYYSVAPDYSIDAVERTYKKDNGLL